MHLWTARDLRRGSRAARLLKLRVEIQSRATISASIFYTGAHLNRYVNHQVNTKCPFYK